MKHYLCLEDLEVRLVNDDPKDKTVKTSKCYKGIIYPTNDVNEIFNGETEILLTDDIAKHFQEMIVAKIGGGIDVLDKAKKHYVGSIDPVVPERNMTLGEIEYSKNIWNNELTKTFEDKILAYHVGLLSKKNVVFDPTAMAFKAITDKMLSTFIKKNADYGNSFENTLDEFGIISAIVRLSDKFNRIKSLSEKEALVKDESIRDTFLDIAVYSVLTTMWLDKQNDADEKK